MKQRGIGDVGVTHHTTHYLAPPALLHSPQTQRWCCREGAGHRRCRSDPQPSPDQTPPTRRPQASCHRCCTWTSSAPLRDPRSVVPPPATHLVLSLQLKQYSPATSHHCLQHIWSCLYNWNRTPLLPLTNVCNTSGTVSTTETELPCYLLPMSATHLVLSLQLKQNSPANSHHCLQHMYPTLTLQLKQNPHATSHHTLQYTYLTTSLQLKQNSSAISRHCLQHIWYCLYTQRRTPLLGHVTASRRSDSNSASTSGEELPH